jgi:hypothetical protein
LEAHSVDISRPSDRSAANILFNKLNVKVLASQNLRSFGFLDQSGFINQTGGLWQAQCVGPRLLREGIPSPGSTALWWRSTLPREQCSLWRGKGPASDNILGPQKGGASLHASPSPLLDPLNQATGCSQSQSYFLMTLLVHRSAEGLTRLTRNKTIDNIANLRSTVVKSFCWIISAPN